MEKIFENLDDLTKTHSIQVAELSSKIAKKLNFTDADVKEVYKLAKYHDVGKQLIPKSILLKPERLTDTEFEIIKKHPIFGVELMKDHLTEKELDVILYHHENVDGSGYFEKEDYQIPYIAKIIRIADVYDALISSRCYKDAYTKEDALLIMSRNVYKFFDPKIFGVFLKIVN